LPAVFWLAAAFGVFTIISVLLIPTGAIDDDEARGLSKGESEDEKSEIAGFKAMFRNRTLLILAAALACFHLGNGGMLPLYGLAVASTKQVDPSELVATAVIVAQSVMIVVSLIATHVGEREGYWRLLLISFAALPIRGVIAAFMINRSGVYPVEILDGIAAGLQTVVVPGLVARVLHRSGRVNAGQGRS
jgi:Na+/melibiose symporter-like transporter